MPSLEGVAMSIKIKKKIKVIVGNFNLKDGPHDVFDKNKRTNKKLIKKIFFFIKFF